MAKAKKITDVLPLDKNAKVSAMTSRSFNMSKIHSKNTKVELLLRKAMWKENIRFRIHTPDIPGKPDILIKKYSLAIFIDGGFWHGYHWEENRKRIKTNINFWTAKIEKNMQRDREINLRLAEMGLTVMRFWDHEVLRALPKCINQILLYIESYKSYPIPTRS